MFFQASGVLQTVLLCAWEYVMASYLNPHPNGGWRYQRRIPTDIRPLLAGRQISVKYISAVARREAERQVRIYALRDDELWLSLRQLTDQQRAEVMRVSVNALWTDSDRSAPVRQQNHTQMRCIMRATLAACHLAPRGVVTFLAFKACAMAGVVTIPCLLSSARMGLSASALESACTRCVALPLAPAFAEIGKPL